ncbi:unnamed protein product [Caenorhabditis angaria]|uniref:Uncharacterized protein n=1 Tax=Caenorhabditis angaria TaxID=860376 RepID=A0A9P1NAJ0_9PELO|nr:unnamed protein product [Caenorhabditis angaria]
MAPPTTIPNLFMSDFGLNTDDIKYFHMDSHIQGRGPNRLKHLDIEGRWVLSGKSIPFISAAFNHLERLNDAQVAIRDIGEEPIDAIGMVGWTKSSEPVKVEPTIVEPAKPKRIVLQPPVFIEEEVPPSPREIVPHRSAGYGQAHQKRKLSIPDRSRSVSPLRAETPPQAVFDKYAKYERHRKDSITRYGTKWGDLGYVSHSPSPTGDEPQNNLPHRTPSLSRPSSRSSRQYDNQYDPAYLKDSSAKHELKVLTKGDNVPYRTTGYGAYHVKRQYELSPRSMGSDYATSSGSEQSSPIPPQQKSADEILLTAYHSTTKRANDLSRNRRDNWIRQ